MPARTPAERTLIAKIAAATRWSRETDRAAATAAARKAAADRFEREVDPDGVLDPTERARRAAAAKAAFYARLQLASLRTRRRSAKPRR